MRRMMVALLLFGLVFSCEVLVDRQEVKNSENVLVTVTNAQRGIVICAPNNFVSCTPSGRDCIAYCKFFQDGLHVISAFSGSVCRPNYVFSQSQGIQCNLTSLPPYGFENFTATLLLKTDYDGETSFYCDASRVEHESVFALNNIGEVKCQYISKTKRKVVQKAIAGSVTCYNNITIYPFEDVAPPIVDIDYNYSSGNYSVYANSSDNFDVANITVFVNNVEYKSSNGEKINIVLPDGSYEVFAKAYDVEGNIGVSEKINMSKDEMCTLRGDRSYGWSPLVVKFKMRIYNRKYSNRTVLFYNTTQGDANNTNATTGFSEVFLKNNEAEYNFPYTSGLFYPFARHGEITCNTTVYVTSTEDLTPPSIQIDPPDGMMNASQLVLITVSDGGYLGGIKVNLDGKGINEFILDNASTSYAYNFTWDNKNVSIGYHMFEVCAYDMGRNEFCTYRRYTVPIFNPCHFKTDKFIMIENESADVEIALSGVRLNYSISEENITTNATGFMCLVWFVNLTSTDNTSKVCLNYSNVTEYNRTVNVTIYNYSLIQESVSNESMHYYSSSAKIKFNGTGISVNGADLGTYFVYARGDYTNSFCFAQVVVVKEKEKCSIFADKTDVILGENVSVFVSSNFEDSLFTIMCSSDTRMLCRTKGKNCTVICPYYKSGEYDLLAMSESCKTNVVKIKASTPKTPSMPPTVKMEREGTLLKATALDDVLVKKIQFYLDGALMRECGKASYKMTCYYIFEPDGKEHNLTIKAYDEDGNEAALVEKIK